MKAVEAVRVAIAIGITIAAQVGLGIWSHQQTLRGIPLNPSVDLLLYWTLMICGLLGVVALIGPKHKQIWPIAVGFVVVTFVGTFIVGQLVMSIDSYR